MNPEKENWEKDKNVGNQHLLLFQQCFFFLFFAISKTNSIIWALSKLSSANTLNLNKSTFLVEPERDVHLPCSHYTQNTIYQRNHLTPFPNKPWFLHVCNTSLLKKMPEKEKLLVTSNFSISQCVLLIWGTFCHFHQIWNCCLSANSFSLEESKICHLGKG